ncbi:MAG: acetaldehyde dehydrogenase (acetylating) [Oscillospiraceae bacterium]
MALDYDLQSIQAVRDLMRDAKAAQKRYGDWNQQQVDALVKAVADAFTPALERLAKLAVEETGFGIWQDKVLKNQLGSQMTYDYIKDMKTVGVIREDQAKKLTEIAVPVGVVAAIIPSTNPTSTTMYKILISLKAGNAVVVSPHPGAKKCILETVRIAQAAAKKAGAPDGLIGCVEFTSMEATDALMRHPDTGIILATGGSAMVKAAYSSGNPALGVGPGNGPSFLEKTADIPRAVKHILDSKTFDNGTICASEQSIVTEECIAGAVKEEAQRQGGYFLDADQSKKLEKMIMRANNTMNPAIVGKSVQVIARMAGITVPENSRVLVSEQTEIGPKNPYSREKLCPILAFYVAKTWEDACETCMKILYNEGAGHTMTIHSENREIVRAFALKKPVSRLLVNTPGALGGVGATTGLAPALTLGCGAVGGSATSDNISPMNLFDIRRVAYGLLELEDLRKGSPVPPAPSECCNPAPSMEEQDIERITREVLNAMRKKA